jgi:GT2 family glycosyltransferase
LTDGEAAWEFDFEVNRAMPEISVIVLNWNGLRFLDTCLTALRRQRFRDFEAILVDNGSEDGSVEFVHRNFPEVSVLSLEENVGFAAGNNIGYQGTQGRWIVLLNNDTEADVNWLQALHEAGLRHPEAGALASMMRDFHERDRIDNCGFDMTFAGATIDLGRGERFSSVWSQEKPVFGGCGGAVAYRRSMIDDIGFLDPDFFLKYEDVDLSFRAQLRGYETRFVPGAIVYHRYRATMKSYPLRQVYFSQRNIEFVYVKNMPLKLIIRYLPHRILYECGAALYFLRIGAGRPFFKAKIDAFRQMPALLKKRRQIQALRTLRDSRLNALFRRSGSGAHVKKLLSAWKNSPVRCVSSQQL